MRGTVEIYRICNGIQTLILKEDNMVVDGASEVIVDMLTTSPGLRENVNFSSILDSSNYCIQAITFGQDKIAASSNAHNPIRPISAGPDGSSLNVSSYLTTNAGPIVLWYTGSATLDTSVAFSSIVGLPAIPNPIDRVLAEGTFQGIGHMVNAFEFSSHFGLSSQEDIIRLGCFGASTGIPRIGVSNVGIANSLSSVQHSSVFNLKGAMDAEGHIGLINFLFSGVSAAGINDVSGSLTVSAVKAASGTGIVSYQTQLDSDDINLLNLYGGVWSIGLWTFDIDKARKKNLTFPLKYNRSGEQMRPYKLFAKKTFTKNIVDSNMYLHPTSTAPEDRLLLVWKINFR